jgi:flavodoxin
MSRTLVAYFSWTGNTRRVAESIFEALDGDKTLKPLTEAGPVEGYGLVFIGFPIQTHSVPFPVETFLKALPKGQRIALFSTHGALPGHRLSREAVEYAVILTGHCGLLGTFSCRGRLSMPALDALGRSPEHQEWADMTPSAATHPDENDLAEARAFARRMKTAGDHRGF